MPTQLPPISAKRNRRQIGENQHSQEAAGHGQRLRAREQLPHELARQIGVAARASDEQTGGQRNQKRRHLADQAVADRQLGEDLGRLRKRHAALHHADHQAADDVDERDQNGGDGIAADELAGTVHRAKEVGLLRDFLAAALGFGFVDAAGVQVGIDRHLPARHAVQGKPGGHFADARGAFGDHHELDDDDDDEDDDADDQLIAGDELAERFHHVPGRQRPIQWRHGSESAAWWPRSAPAGPAWLPTASWERR